MSTTPSYLADWDKHFILHRPHLIAFSFRLTGSLAEAEDMVQETFIACDGTDPLTIENHRAWLTRVCSHRSLDLLRSAYKKRETYPGVWLPDAVPESFKYWGEEEKSLLEQESLTTSFLLLLPKLGPEERVTYLLGDILEYSYKEIAEVLQKSEDACKKIGQRARKALDNQKRFHSNNVDNQKVVAKLFELAKRGDTQAVLEMLAPDAEFWADGGGKVSVASKSVIRDHLRTARFFAGVWSSPVALNNPIHRHESIMVNGRPGLVISSQDENGYWKFHTIISIEVENGKIARIFTQRNPEKLGALDIGAAPNSKN
jgi:RNA polymerase sigma-70 factor (ECF subfamily)